MDEAGRGPLAGPLVASAVCIMNDPALQEVTDSKKLSSRKRMILFDEIINRAAGYSIGIVEASEIDETGMTEAVRLAFSRAAGSLDLKVNLYLVDGLPVRDLDLPAKFIVRGDSKSLSIAAASIIAKVSRDRMMIEADVIYPGYGFASHKGYGTRRHLEALRRLGPSPIHRMSFAPLKNDTQLRFRFE